MKSLILFLLIATVSLSYSQIDMAEYFIDTDPGVNAGTTIPLSTPGNSINESFTINTGSLSNGIHTLYVRTRDINNAWSLYYKHNFLVHDFTDATTPSQIIAAEYFIDTDPGTDNGTEIVITPGFSVSESLAISTAAISDGIHTLYIRTKDADNTWSLYFKYNFLVHTFTSPVQTQINKAEYFFDTDPGVGLGDEITITSGFTLNESINVPSGSLSLGMHYLHIRTRDEDGVWSLYEVIPVQITEPLSVDDKFFVVLNVYPIPAEDFIDIEVPDQVIKNIELYNLQGKLVSELSNISYSEFYRMDLTGFSQGLFILQIETDRGIQNKKILIK